MKRDLDALIFIDTNIYLDFYRNNDKSFEYSMIKHFDKNHHKIITTDQVLMEYKKNRQTVILDSLELVKKPDINLYIPAFLSESSQVKTIRKLKHQLNKQINILKNRIKRALNEPTVTDPLYQCMQRLFKEERPFHLGRKNKNRFEIRKLAWKRFYLGYPPRKDSDTSFGDSINWEWIINCAEQSKKDIIIVSRDNDYGRKFDQEPILNDWLKQEFKDRISQKRKIILTNKLSNAFKLINVPVTKKEQQLEDDLIRDRLITEGTSDSNFIKSLLQKEGFAQKIGRIALSDLKADMEIINFDAHIKSLLDKIKK